MGVLRINGMIAATVSFAGAASAMAAPPPGARPELLNRLVECKAIADPTKRLACYDAQVEAIDVAEKKQDLVIMDRKQVRETRKSLFGFSLPNFSLGGKKLDEADDIKEIEGKLASVRRNGYTWVLVLDKDAGTWETNEPLSKDPPEAGDDIRIKKASMGSYLGSVGFNRGVRFRRVN